MPSEVLSDSAIVRRYLSFSKFASVLQRKQLWLSRSDLLGDAWELTIFEKQAQAILRGQVDPMVVDRGRQELKELIRRERSKTFVNCWSVSDDESYALWHVYCGPTEGVAMETTLGRLRESVGRGAVRRVTYGPHGESGSVPRVQDLVIQKRPMFAYEQEVRIVHQQNFAPGNAVGLFIDWDPELHLDAIRVHPRTEFWFLETVTDVVQRMAPGLCTDGFPRVWRSAMDVAPPF